MVLHYAGVAWRDGQPSGNAVRQTPDAQVLALHAAPCVRSCIRFCIRSCNDLAYPLAIAFAHAHAYALTHSPLLLGPSAVRQVKNSLPCARDQGVPNLTSPHPLNPTPFYLPCEPNMLYSLMQDMSTAQDPAHPAPGTHAHAQARAHRRRTWTRARAPGPGPQSTPASLHAAGRAALPGRLR